NSQPPNDEQPQFPVKDVAIENIVERHAWLEIVPPGAGAADLERQRVAGETVIADVQHALQTARGLGAGAADTHLADETVRGLERAKWRLWHGRWTGCRRKLAALCRWTKRKHVRDLEQDDSAVLPRRTHRRAERQPRGRLSPSLSGLPAHQR